MLQVRPRHCEERSNEAISSDSFSEKLAALRTELRKGPVEILQVNLGRLCNLACVHCHVEAGPTKTTENMNRETAEAVVRFLDRCNAVEIASVVSLPRNDNAPVAEGFQQIKTLDITGGAPELNPHFKYLVAEATKRGLHVMDRCNLTVLYEPGMADIPNFLAQHRVEIIASLPCYQKDNVDKQRGGGAFDKSIAALQWLNCLGYGKPWTGLVLNLVYNPVGPNLPSPQKELEADYKQRLAEDWGIVFNGLYTIANMPITRYAKYLRALGQYDAYVELLAKHFNPATLDGLMCRNTLSVGWDGKLYDCDFNQALGMQSRNGKPLTIFDAIPQNIEGARILTGMHCFGCTAGAGSSCRGALT